MGLDLKNAVFAHGQLYVTVSRVTSVHNIKTIWDSRLDAPAIKTYLLIKISVINYKLT